ncbi:MAG TPA: ribosomal protein S18-alanine N-acetyltransferase [Burkholderiales bacterium]|nr:ribosomal protein S18-alanine N-acetyltransferase [Burkholderiales bacterium]
MSAQLDVLPLYRRMTADDLDAVLAIEDRIYPHPWTRGNFSDSLAAGYHCLIMEIGGEIAGYSIVMAGAGEAHLLNLSVAAGWQRRGLGRELLRHLLELARREAVERILLEVRESNRAAQALYENSGFSRIALRRDYYPADHGREDAVVMAREL